MTSSSDVAGVLEKRIEHAWLNAGSPAVTLLMSRGLREAAAGAHADAIDDFDAALALDPKLAEAWRQQTRQIFQTYLTKGYRVVDFFLSDTSGRGHYLLAIPA